MNILVDRKSKTSAHRAFVRAGEELDAGNSVFIFPEGGILSSGQVTGFKNGAFKLAIDKQMPIVPIIYLNNWKLLQNGGFFKSFGKPGVSNVIVTPPIITKGMTENDLVFLKTKVRELIINELNSENENR